MGIRLALAVAASLAMGNAEAAGADEGGPALEPVPCWFSVPEDRAADCFRFEVLEDRSRPDGWKIKLPVVILTTPAMRRHEDPVIFLAGGPGYGAGLEGGDMLYWWGFISGYPWAQTRDLILFDQRGAGMAEPPLSCPEIRAIAVELLQSGTDDAARDEVVRAAVRACRERLIRDGHNLAAYDSAASAIDIEELRVALGVERWNLFGSSYGTRLALTLMRDHPEGVRTAILDSVYPPEAPGYEDAVAAAARAFGRLFKNCAASSECDERHPDLERVLLATADYLDRYPRTVTRPNPLTGRQVEIVLTGELLMEWILDQLYVKEDIVGIPRLIHGIADGRMSAFELMADELLELYLDFEGFGEAMYLSVECREEFPFNDPSRVASEVERLPAYKSLVSEDFSWIACPDWQVAAAPAIEAEPVRSEIPTMVLAGEYDPITPPAWARLAASRLPNSFLFEFAGEAHGVLGTNECAGILVGRFLDDPSIMPMASCLGTPESPPFEVPIEGAPPERRDQRKGSTSQ